MAFVLLVFAIGVLNLALGFAVAVHLSSRQLTLVDAEDGLCGSARSIEQSDGDRRGVGGEPPTAEQPELPLPGPAAAEDLDPDLELERIDFPTFGRFVATAVSALTDFTARLQKNNRGDQQRTAWAFVAELQEICQPYLNRVTQAVEQLLDEVGDKIQGLLLEQLAQLETTLNNLRYMDFDSGASAAFARLAQETGNTLSMARELQEALEADPETPDGEGSHSALA